MKALPEKYVDCPYFIPGKYCYVARHKCHICCLKCKKVLECDNAACHGHITILNVNHLSILDKLKLVGGKLKVKNTHVGLDVLRKRKKDVIKEVHREKDVLLRDS